MTQKQQSTIDHMVSRFKNERSVDATYEVRMSGKFAYVQFHVKTPNPFPELRIGPKAGWWSDAQCRGGEIRTFPNPAMDSLLYADELLAKQDKISRGKVAPGDARTTKYKKPKTTYQTVTLDRACRAVKVYNEGLDGRGVENADLDIRAHKVFARGLGSTSEEIERQVHFIGNRKDYGGVAGRPSAINLAPAIAHDIFEIREEYERTASSTVPLLSQVAERSTIEFLFRPFVQPLGDKNNTKNWLVWAAKFWHHLNRDAFPIESSESDEFFVIGNYNGPVDRYMKLLNKFRTFVLSHQEWLPHLRQADGGVDGEVDGEPVCSDNKLWDKMCVGLNKLDKAGK